MSHFIFNMFKKVVLNVLIKNENPNIYGTGGERVIVRTERTVGGVSAVCNLQTKYKNTVLKVDNKLPRGNRKNTSHLMNLI